MKKLFFFVLPLLAICAIIPFNLEFEKTKEELSLLSSQSVEQVQESQTDYVTSSPKSVKRKEPEVADLLKFPFGYIDNATFVLPDGIYFV